MSSSASAIEITGLTKSYGRKVAVDRLTLNVPRGSIFGFLGPNGSGKTTTIRVLLGLLRATQGRAAVLGHDAWRDSAAIKQHVGYMPGDIRLPPWLTCRKGLAISAAAGHDRTCTTRGHDLAERFELDCDVPVQSMSRGMRQKLGLILSLAHAPQVLILDEPTASLDPIMQSRLYDVLRQRAADGHTVFLSSHTLSEVEQLCENVAILRTGRLVAEDTIDNLRRRAMRVATVTWKSAPPAPAAKSNDSAAGPSTSSTAAPNSPEASTPTPSVAASLPPGCEIIDRSAAQWRFHLQGPAADFVRWCATQPIADVTIGEPDLTEVFRSYYE